MRPTKDGPDVAAGGKLLRELDTGVEALKPVFLKFEQFDRRLLNDMEHFMRPNREFPNTDRAIVC